MENVFHGKMPIKCMEAPRWFNIFQNSLVIKVVPQFSTNNMSKVLNKVFNGICLISVKFLGNEISSNKVYRSWNRRNPNRNQCRPGLGIFLFKVV